MSALLTRFVGVAGCGKVLATLVPSVIRKRSRLLDGRLIERSAYEFETQGRVHGRERIVNEWLRVNALSCHFEMRLF